MHKQINKLGRLVEINNTSLSFHLPDGMPFVRFEHNGNELMSTWFDAKDLREFADRLLTAADVLDGGDKQK